MGLKDSFVRRGYIPRELIPPFKSESLADALPSLASDFSTLWNVGEQVLLSLYPEA
jgi:hypothetical protein